MKYISVLFLIFVIAIVVLADANELPVFIKQLYDFPYGDKAGHFILFGLLSFFISLSAIHALPKHDPKLVCFVIALILTLLMGAEEFSQRYFSNRTFDLLDLLASLIGICVGGIFAFLKK